MAYELRVPGRPSASFETEPEAIEAVRALLRAEPDAEPELFDLATGKPCAPAASRSWREEFRNSVGF